VAAFLLSADPGRGGAGLALDVELGRDVYPQGRTITAAVVWRSAGTEPVGARVPLSPFSRVLAFDVRARGGPRPSAVKWSGPGDDGAPVVLEGGTAVRAEYDVTAIYPELMPGSYELVVRYDDGIESATSPAASFRVEVPAPVEREALAAYRAAVRAAERETVIERALELVGRDPASPVAKRARMLLFENYGARGDWEAAVEEARRLREREDLSSYEWVATEAGLARALGVLRCLVGDCDRDQRVEIADLWAGWKLLFDLRRLPECRRLDPDGNGRITAAEWVHAVRDAGGLCR